MGLIIETTRALKSYRNLGVNETRRRTGVSEVHLFDRNIPFKTNAQYFLKGVYYAIGETVSDISSHLNYHNWRMMSQAPIEATLQTYSEAHSKRSDIQNPLGNTTTLLRVANTSAFSTNIDIEPLRRMKTSKAFVEVEKLLAQNPDHMELLCFKARCLSKMGKYSEAERLLQQIISDHPQEPLPRNGLAKVYFMQKRYDETERMYLSTIAIFPGDVFAQSGLAHLYTIREEYLEAEKAYRENATQFPLHAIAQNDLANFLATRGRYDDAAKIYQQTTINFPDNIVARNGLANTYAKLRKFADAKQIYRETAEKFPHDAYARNCLANMLVSKKKIAEAERAFRIIVRDFRHDVFSRLGLAMVLVKQRRFDEALGLIYSIAELKQTEAEEVLTTYIKIVILLNNNIPPQKCIGSLLAIIKEKDYSRAAIKGLERGLAFSKIDFSMRDELETLIRYRMPFTEDKKEQEAQEAQFERNFSNFLARLTILLVEQKHRLTEKPLPPISEDHPAILMVTTPLPTTPPPKIPDTKETVKILLEQIGKDQNNKNITLLSEALRQLSLLNPKEISISSSKEELQQILRFLSTLKAQLKDKQRDEIIGNGLLEAAKQKLIAALRTQPQ